MGKRSGSNQIRMLLPRDLIHLYFYLLVVAFFFENCFMIMADNESQLSSSPDSATWTGILSSTYISLGTALIFMFIFEFGRRHPAVAAVFDRRRQTNPHRTPPPLIKSRICEWLFLRTDPAYLLYAEKLDEKDKERRRKQQLQEATSEHQRDLHNQERDVGNHDRSRNLLQKMKNIFHNFVGKGVDTKAVVEEVPPQSRKPAGAMFANAYPSDTFTQNTFSSSSVNTTRQIASGADADIQRTNKTNDFSSNNFDLQCSSNEDKSSTESSSSSYFGDYSEDEKSQNSEVLDQLESGKRKSWKSTENDCPTPRSHKNLKHQNMASFKETAEVVCVNNCKIPKDLVNYVITSDFPLEQLEQLEPRSRENLVLVERKSMQQRDQLENFQISEDEGLQKKFGVQQLTVSDGPSEIKEEFPAEQIGRPQGRQKSITKLAQNRQQSIDSKRKHILLECTELVHNKHPLKVADQELLRCVGLDLFVSLRFLRFCFDVSFYPFLVAVVVLIPTYYTNDYGGTATYPTNGYFQFTMSRLQNGSPRLWVCFVFSVCFYLGVLRRLWVEWETFIPLRYEFLANGDSEAIKEQDHVEQYRCSCMIEYVPECLRGDEQLFKFFNALFPGQVERAEILLNASRLTELIEEREKNIKLYENVYAKHYHKRALYNRKMEIQRHRSTGIMQHLFCVCSRKPPKRPKEPMVCLGRDWKRCGRRKIVKALPYYLSEIKRLNDLIDEEHKKILQEKLKTERPKTAKKFDVANHFANFSAGAIALMTGVASDLNCDTGFVQFKTITAKQSAVQCNISGTSNFLVTSPAPDPRDVIWRNAIVERGAVFLKQKQIYGLLLTCLLFWAPLITGINTISNLNTLGKYLPQFLVPKPGSFWAGLIQGWLPVVLLEAVMKVLINALNIIAKRYIRYKSRSEVDMFVYKWNFAYRLANIFIIIVSGSLLKLLQSAASDANGVFEDLAKGISSQSQFFLNNVIVAIGTESLMELAQIRAMIVHFVMHQFITVEAKSQRYLEKLQEADKFEWGEDVPQFLFVFMVSVVYAAQVPLILGFCALYFYICIKVYVHQCLFVYSQPYEGGGKLMKLLNRTVFTTLYVGIFIFSTTLALKNTPVASPAFLFMMGILTAYVDFKIQKTFVAPSETLALVQARVIDEKDRKKQMRLKLQLKKEESKKQLLTDVSSEGPATNVKMGRSSVGIKSHSSSQFAVTNELSSVEMTDRRRSYFAHSKLAAKFGKTSLRKTIAGDDQEKEDFYLYRQPHLNKSIWETKPRPYR